jgi:hypothetical protein
MISKTMSHKVSIDQDDQSTRELHSELSPSSDAASKGEQSLDYMGVSLLVKRVGSASFELQKEEFSHEEMQVIRKSFKYSGYPMKTKQSNKKLGYYENHCLKCSAKLILKKNRVHTGLCIHHKH